ncbi:unnamed protein product [Cylicocyclus nassatus]|uniref:Uncharacterized protein n=1 Tax=Cylicocyclus nassatus TaxID=53992 RepID=A0AA36MDB3_CYLNA|nr:unnamed protein product [Cylicocyclus nassatus]
MALKDEIKFEKEVDRIEAELGDDHLVRMLQYLTSSSPEASQGLLDLHSECRNVISKLPPMKSDMDSTKKRTQSQGTINNRQRTVPLPPRPSRVKTEKPRIMLTKRTNSIPANTKKSIAT